ncbi:hypothetical protein [Muricoccus radiodurans]|uniref:hypothetical protein n=1 Tax=Muricoccus radiodurans TaxID=2231721 RepID=UPI003CED497E
MSQSQSTSANTLAVAVPEGAPTLRHRVSWGAILAGALVAIAVGTTLNILGAAIGFSTVDAVARDTPSASSLGIGGAIWFLVSNLIGLAVGGYVAARLSGTADGKDATLHGLAVWAAAYLVTAVLLHGAASGLASAAGTLVQGAGSAIGGAAQGAGQAVSSALPQVDPDEMVQRARMALSGPTDPARMTTEQRSAELTSLLTKRAVDGNFNDNDRRRANQLVAAEAGIPEQEADQRIRAYEADAQRVAQEAERRAREAADAAAKAASAAAFWVFAGLLLGAIATIIGARIGTRDAYAMVQRQRIA